MIDTVSEYVYKHICQILYNQDTSDKVYAEIIPQGVENPVWRYMIDPDGIHNTKDAYEGGLSAVDYYAVTIDAYASTYKKCAKMCGDFRMDSERTRAGYDQASFTVRSQTRISYEEDTDSWRGMTEYQLRWTNDKL